MHFHYGPVMRKRYRIALTVLFVTIAGLIAWQSLREPVYQGKRLSVWLDQYGTNHFPTVRDGPLGKEAETAIRRIGTNAIPVYLKILTTRDPPLKLKVMALVSNRWLARLQVRSVYDYRWSGAFGLIALGTEAKSALPALFGLLSDKDEWMRYVAGFTLESLGPVAGDDLLPLLKNCLQDPDVMVQSEAIRILGQIHQKPDRVIPILVEILAKPQSPQYTQRIRTDAIQALRQLGAEAKPAVPTLVALLNDADAPIRSAATNALKSIDPGAVTTAGVVSP